MTRQVPTLKSRGGFSLVEMVISLGLSSLVIAVFYGTVANLQRDYRGQRDTRMAEEALRTAEQVLRTVLQGAGADPKFTGLGVLHPDPLNTGSFDNLHVKSDINPPDGDFDDMLEDVRVRVQADSLMVQWNSTGSYQALVYPVRAIRFEYFDAAGTPITTVAGTATATSVRFTISAPESPVSNVLRRRQAWVFLQNRR
ncbi:MAG TPA: type II secretion system protein [Longimicrobiales bacterium]